MRFNSIVSFALLFLVTLSSPVLADSSQGECTEGREGICYGSFCVECPAPSHCSYAWSPSGQPLCCKKSVYGTRFFGVICSDPLTGATHQLAAEVKKSDGMGEMGADKSE